MKALDYDGLDYVVDKITDMVNSGTSADYIVEQGVSGIWNYRKWASGISECWAIYGATLTSYAVPWEGASAFYTSVTFPTGLFVATPNMTTDFKCDSVLSISCGGLHSLTATGTNLYGISIGASGSQSCTWNIRVVGRWKEFTPSAVRSAVTAPALVYRRVLTSADNVNDIKESGFYYIADSVPQGLSYYDEARAWSYLMVVSHGDPTFVEQIYIRPQTSMFMMRTFSGSPASWGAWKRLMGYSKCAEIGVTNANSLTDNGFFTGNNLTNAPRTGWLVYQVMRQDNNPSYVNQVAYPIGDSTKIYQRTMNGEGNWSTWSIH